MIKNTLKILTGTATGQLILIISIPFITRLYSPESFGNYALFLSIAGLLGIIGSYRIEYSLSKYKYKTSKITTIVLIIFIIILNTIIFTLITYLIYFFIPKIHEVYTFLPVCIFFNSTYQSAVLLLAAEKKFDILAKVKFLQAIFLVLFQFSLYEYGVEGLVYSHLMSIIFVTIIIIINIQINLRIKINNIKIKNIKNIFIVNLNYITKSTPAALISSFGMNLPIFFLSNFYSPVLTGLYSLSNRILFMPCNLITNALSKVIISESKAFKDKINVKNIYDKNLRVLNSIIMLPLFILSLIEDNIYIFVFGEEWKGIGEVIRFSLPWLFISFITNPCLIIYEVRNKQNKILNFNIMMILMRVISLVFGYYFFDDTKVILLFSLVSCLCWYILLIDFTKEYNMSIRNYNIILILLLIMMVLNIQSSLLAIMIVPFYLIHIFNVLRNEKYV